MLAANQSAIELSKDVLEKNVRTALNVYAIVLVFLKTLIATLAGVIGMQYITYSYHSRKHDPRWLKWLAVAVALLSVGEAVTDIVLLNKLVLLGASNPAGVMTPTNCASVEIVITVLTSICVQSYYAFVVYRLLSYSKIWLGVILLLLLAELATGIGAAAALALLAPSGDVSLSKRPSGWNIRLYISWVALTALVDTASSLVLCVKFLRAHRSSSFRRTHDLMGQLLVMTFETFGLTAVISIVGLLFTLIPMIFNIPNPSLTALHSIAVLFPSNLLGKLYPISLFYSLNRRSALREGAWNSSINYLSSSGLQIPAVLHRSQAIHVDVKASAKLDLYPNNTHFNISAATNQSTEFELADRRTTSTRKDEAPD